MSEIRIDWGSGHMTLNIENTFPCGLNRAKRLCHLINQYSNEEDKKKLKSYLEGEAKMLKEAIEKPKHLKSLETEYARCLKNLEFLDSRR